MVIILVKRQTLLLFRGVYLKERDVSGLNNISTEQVIWFLQEFENADDDQLEDVGCEIYGEDGNGNEGSCFVTTQDICGRGALEIQRLKTELDEAKAERDELLSLMRESGWECEGYE